MLRSFWGKWFRYNSYFGWALILLFGIPRFILVLNASRIQSYGSVSFIFLFMWIAPFLFLTSEGRGAIGLKMPSHYGWLVSSFFAGVLACAVMFGAATWAYEHTSNNWLVYISRSYALAINHSAGEEKQMYFMIYAIIAMTLSPVGEELMYRGLIHGSFATQIGEYKASILDSLAFAITHLAHFGIVFISGSWRFLFFPGLLWVLFMFGAGQLFFLFKEKTGSLLGAMFCHAGFNLAMTYFIFYHIL